MTLTMIIIGTLAAATIIVGVCFFQIRHSRASRQKIGATDKQQNEISSNEMDTWQDLRDAQLKVGERRIHRTRRGGNPTAILLLESDAAKPQKACVLDRCEGGLRLAVLHEFAVDSVIRIQAENAPEKTPWVEVIVCWCTTLRNGFDIGCKFTETVPVNVRLLFG